MPDTEHRKLAAIMFTDVTGYSAPRRFASAAWLCLLAATTLRVAALPTFAAALKVACVGDSITHPTSNRAALNWPGQWAGLVLQSTLALRPADTAWTVVELVAVNDGTTVRVTNSVPSGSRFYRLWQP